MSKVALPALISTSCSAERNSSVTCAEGNERTTSRVRRAGSTTVPSRITSASSGTRRPTSMSVARSSHPEDVAASWTPDRAWIAERVEATRLTVCS
jgi:hypothetical protein